MPDLRTVPLPLQLQQLAKPVPRQCWHLTVVDGYDGALFLFEVGLFVDDEDLFDDWVLADDDAEFFGLVALEVLLVLPVLCCLC